MLVEKTIMADTKEGFDKLFADAINYMWKPVWETFRHSVTMTSTEGKEIHFIERFIIIMYKIEPNPPEMCNTCISFLEIEDPDGAISYDCLEDIEDGETVVDDEGWCDKYKRGCYNADTEEDLT